MASGKATLKLYNTLTRAKGEFTPLDPGNVRMYACGPTVYDFAHIGNARPVIVFDVLFRLLRHLYGADHVTYVRNITDVDDKINARAALDYPDLPLNEAIRRVTETTNAQFQADAKALGCLEPTVQPRATEHIIEMIAMIQQLLDKGHAYIARGEEGREALFDVTSMPEYGELSRREATAKLAGARIDRKDHKRNPEDFVLWKESDPAEPGWDAEFTISEENRAELHLNSTAVKIRGRPGWHIECSAMSERYLWEEARQRLSPKALAHPHQFDIHAGGLDLIFPHHENEIAQSRCAHGTPVMANYWLHNGFLQVEGRKMAKSEGNFVTISDLLNTEKFGGRKWPGGVLRLAMLKTHYREPIDFSRQRLVEANTELRGWMKMAERFVPVEDPQPHKDVIEALSDDLNFSKTKLVLDKLSAQTRMSGDEGERAAAGQALADTLVWLGLARLEDFEKARKSRAQVRETLVRQMIDLRLAALNAKDFTKADTIRGELLKQGIQLMDSKDPVTGERITTWEVKR